MSTFTTARLTNGQTLVRGTDANGATGQTTVDSSQWDSIKAQRDYQGAERDFTAEVEAFFAPLTKAADRLKDAAQGPAVDPVSYVVMSEEVEGVQAKPAVVTRLTQDSVVLRLIEAGDFDRLVWVDEHTLAVLEVLPGTAVPTSTQVVADVAGGEPVEEGEPAPEVQAPGNYEG